MSDTPTCRRTAEDRLGARFLATASADLSHALTSQWQMPGCRTIRSGGDFVGDTKGKLDSWLTLS